MDLKSFSDTDLGLLRRDVLNEQDRRHKVAKLPEDLADMTRAAIEAGCDPDGLRTAVEDVLREAK